MRVFNFESQSEFKRTKYVIQFSQYPKNPHYEKRSHQTIIFGQILVVLNLTISIKCHKQKKTRLIAGITIRKNQTLSSLFF
jgi:hypothetical protein